MNINLSDLLNQTPEWMGPSASNFAAAPAYLKTVEDTLATLQDPLSIDQLSLVFQLQTIRQVINKWSNIYSRNLKTLILLDRTEDALICARMQGYSHLKPHNFLAIYHSLEEIGIQRRDVLSE